MSLLPEISQASTEINKLVAQANIHQTIAPVNPAAFTDPADTMLLASRDPVIREVSVGMTGEAYSDYSVSGTPPLSLPNSLGKPLKAWEVEVSPYQDLHGYSNPWPAGGGVNKLNMDDLKSGYVVSEDGSFVEVNWYKYYEYLPVSGDTLYLLGTTASTSSIRGVCFYDEDKAFISGVMQEIDSTAQAYTIPSGAVYVSFNVSNTVTSPLASFTQPSGYSPYSNLCPIYGTDKLNLFVEESYDQSATPKAVLTLPQTVYTGTIGSEGGESRSAVVDLGTLNWVAAGNANVFYTTGLARANLNTASAIYRCEKYVYRGIAPGNDQAYINGNNSFSVYSGADARVWIRDDAQWGDVAAFKASLQGVLLEYELVNPQAFPLTSPTIPTPTGTATTWATAEDGTVDSMEVTYYKSE